MLYTPPPPFDTNSPYPANFAPLFLVTTRPPSSTLFPYTTLFRSEVEALARVLARGGGRQEHGVVVEVGDGGAGGLLGQSSGLEADGVRAEAAVVDVCNGGFRVESHVVS